MRIVVADDEDWVRSIITRTIPFEELGITLAAEASNGLEALQMCKQHKPDILLTDIMMPGLTGIELINQAKMLLPEMKIVIISGYNDFEYARAAIEYGVSSYVLKPIDEDEIVKVILKLKEEILTQKRSYEENTLIRKQHIKAVTIIQENLLNRLVKQNFLTSEAIKNDLLKCGISMDYPYFTVAVFKVRGTLTTLLSSGVKTLIQKVVRKHLSGVVFLREGYNDEFIAVLNHNNPQTAQETELKNSFSKTLIKCFTYCSRLIKSKFDYDIQIGVSLTSNRIRSLPELYNQASDALSIYFWNPSNVLFLFSPYNDVVDSIHIDDSVIRDIVFNIRFGSFETIVKYILDLFENNKLSGRVSPQDFKEQAVEFMHSVIITLNLKRKSSGYEGIDVYKKYPLNIIRSLNTIKDLSDYMKEIFKYLFENFNEVGNDEQIGTIETVKKIMHDISFSDISLEEAAGHVDLNPSYLSQLFKKNTGMSFIDYKTQVRIEKAKELLEETSQTIEDISSSLGYTDSKYFSKLFKKITGITIQEFRKKQGLLQKKG